MATAPDKKPNAASTAQASISAAQANAPAAAAPGKKPNAVPMAMPKVKKPMSAGAAAGICVVVFLFLLGGLFAALLTNTLNLGDMLISVMPQYKVMAQGIDKQKSDIAAAQAKLQKDADKVAEDKKANQKEAKRLKAGEDALAADRQAFEAQTQDAVAAEKRRKMVIDVFSGMSSTKAAAILSAGYSDRQAADLMVRMPEEISSRIFEAMDPAKAAEITKLMGQ